MRTIWSPPSRGAWIEIIVLPPSLYPLLPSPPSRGAWIEITYSVCSPISVFVAPLAGGVD